MECTFRITLKRPKKTKKHSDQAEAGLNGEHQRCDLKCLPPGRVPMRLTASPPPALLSAQRGVRTRCAQTPHALPVDPLRCSACSTPQEDQQPQQLGLQQQLRRHMQRQSNKKPGKSRAFCLQHRDQGRSHTTTHAGVAGAYAAMPLCRSSASMLGSRPRKARKFSAAGRLPPRLRISARKRWPVAASCSSPASSKAA